MECEVKRSVKDAKDRKDWKRNCKKTRDQMTDEGGIQANKNSEEGKGRCGRRGRVRHVDEFL